MIMYPCGSFTGNQQTKATCAKCQKSMFHIVPVPCSCCEGIGQHLSAAQKAMLRSDTANKRDRMRIGNALAIRKSR